MKDPKKEILELMEQYRSLLPEKDERPFHRKFLVQPCVTEQAPDPNLIAIPDDKRNTHIYMPGKTRHGKSTLMLGMILQDIGRGNGVCLMDGKGDFAPALLEWIPTHRKDDVIYLDIDTPVPLDFMGYTNNEEKDALISELMFLLTKTADPAHIPIIRANLTSLLLTLFNYNKHPETPDHCRATFLDIHNFLEDPERRAVILSRVTDPNLKRHWEKPINPQDAARITSRTTPVVFSPSLARIFGGKKPRLKIPELVDSRKILIVNLGPITDNRRLYGTLLLSKIREAILRRAALPKNKIVPFYLYCDEFQEFQTPEFSKMLSLGGGLGLCLTLAHQYISKLDADIRDAILGNVSTFICFRLGVPSANCLRGEIPKEYIEMLPTLPVGRAVYRAADGMTQLIHTSPPPEQLTSFMEGRAAGRIVSAEDITNIKKRTIDTYGCEPEQKCDTPVHARKIDYDTVGPQKKVP